VLQRNQREEDLDPEPCLRQTACIRPPDPVDARYQSAATRDPNFARVEVGAGRTAAKTVGRDNGSVKYVVSAVNSNRQIVKFSADALVAEFGVPAMLRPSPESARSAGGGV